MLKRFRWLGLVGSAFLLVALATAPAQAGVLDCIEVVAPAKALQDAVEAAANAAQCVGQAASGDAVMIAAIGAITALRAGGAFSNTAECMGMINSMIGKSRDAGRGTCRVKPCVQRWLRRPLHELTPACLLTAPQITAVTTTSKAHQLAKRAARGPRKGCRSTQRTA